MHHVLLLGFTALWHTFARHRSLGDTITYLASRQNAGDFAWDAAWHLPILTLTRVRKISSGTWVYTIQRVISIRLRLQITYKYVAIHLKYYNTPDKLVKCQRCPAMSTLFPEHVVYEHKCLKLNGHYAKHFWKANRTKCPSSNNDVTYHIDHIQ